MSSLSDFYIIVLQYVFHNNLVNFWTSDVQ